MAGDEEEKHAGKELSEADEAEVEGALGGGEDLPADRDGLHFESDDQAETGDLEEAEIAEAENCEAFGCGGFWEGLLGLGLVQFGFLRRHR